MCEQCISKMVPRKGLEELRLNNQCRLCFKEFALGFIPVYRSMDDPTVCEACWKAGTDTSKLDTTLSGQIQPAYAGIPPQHQWPPSQHDINTKPFASVITRESSVGSGSVKVDQWDAQQKAAYTPLQAAPQGEIEVTPQGGKHSKIGVAFHHLDPELMLALGAILYTGGAKYGRDNWKNISVEDHLNHALAHVWTYLAEGQPEDIEHAILRLMFAWTVNQAGGNYRAAS